MAISTNDILGYLQVLGYAPVLERLTPTERAIGRDSLLGCYNRLMESLEPEVYNASCRVLYMAISRREHLNVKEMLPRGNPQLEEATAEVAVMLLDYIRSNVVTDVVKRNFLNELDAVFAKILEPKNATAAN